MTGPVQAPAAPATDTHSPALARGAAAQPGRLTLLWGRRWPGLAGDVRIDLFAFLFALGMLHHELQFILEQQRIGPIGEYMERWSRVRPSSGWSSELGLALHLADVAISVLILAFYPLFLSPGQAQQLLGRCLTRPSVPRLAGAVVISASGIASIRQADHVTTLYTRGAAWKRRSCRRTASSCTRRCCSSPT